jgi:glycosyltransferase involved in cell wall biosynthesis
MNCLKTIRVLSIIYGTNFGGPHNLNLAMLEPLKKHNVELEILVPEKQYNVVNRFKEKGIDLITLPLTRAGYGFRISKIIKYIVNFPRELNYIRNVIRKSCIDIVMINDIGYIHGVIAARLEKIAVVQKVTSTILPKFISFFLINFTCIFADVILCCGKNTAKYHRIASNKKTKIYFPLVDTEKFKFSNTTRVLARESLGIKQGKLVIGNVNNIAPMKNHVDFIRAAAIFKKNLPDTVFVILGALYPHYREYTEYIFREAKLLGFNMGKNLIINDPGCKVHILAQAFDFFWQTSKPLSESISTTIIEAMSLSLPVLSYNAGTISELINNKKNGIIIKDFCPQTLAKETEKLLENKERLEPIRKRARKTVEEKFSVEKTVEEHIKAFTIAYKIKFCT